MPKFVVTAGVTISVVKTIEAKSAKAARVFADNLTLPTLCHHCTNAGEDDESSWELTGGELDGTPEILEVCDVDN